MADLTFDGMLRVSWIPTIASATLAPTVAELTAGVDLTPRLLPDGLSISAETASVDNTKMDSTSNSQKAGRRSYEVSVKYVRGTAVGEITVETALTYRAPGFLVVRRDVTYATAWAAAQKVEVYPGEIGEANPDSPAPDTLQAVEVPLMVTADPKSITSRVAVLA